MSPISIALLAFGMSADAFAASLGRGAATEKLRLTDALRTGAIFGLVEAATPLIGWAAGMVAAGSIAAVDHWIAFGLLGLVGGRMLLEALRRAPDAVPSGRSLAALVMVAIGTSIDAMAVGVSLAFLDADIWTIAAAIGAATFLMATGGMLAGRLLGSRLGRIAEAMAGVVLIGLGSAILYEHLTA